jgi:hypothetical protein
VSNLVRLLNLSEEILELLERGELSCGHGLALLRCKDPRCASGAGSCGVAGRMDGTGARTLVPVQSNVDVLEPSRIVVSSKIQSQTQDPEQVRDLAALTLARAWGELLGAEVHVRVLRRGQMRMEVLFDSAAEGIALADRLAAAIARGSKGR